MRLLDDRFLTVHPRTVLWWEQREQCRRCRHVRMVQSKPMRGGETTIMWHCKAASAEDAERLESCLDSRDGLCGPNAFLFEPAD